MSSKLFIKKQFFLKKNFEINKFQKLVLNIVSNDSVIPFGINYINENKGKNNSKSIFHTRCQFSGRARANFNKFKMSRMIFKKYSGFGLLNGVKKSNW